MANSGPPNLHGTTEANPASKTPVSGLSLDGTTNFSLTEIFALPEDERNHLKKRLGVVSWEPLTFKVLGTPADKYEIVPHDVMRKEMMEARSIPDDDEDECKATGTLADKHEVVSSGLTRKEILETKPILDDKQD
jgi:hypothetical protein